MNASAIKDDFQSVLCSLRTQCLWVSLDGMWIDVIHDDPLTLSLRNFRFFFQQLHWFSQPRSCFIKWYHKEWSIKLLTHNGGWHETLNLPHVSSCEMLHFVTSYMNQNKNVNKLSRVHSTDWKSSLKIFYEWYLKVLSVGILQLQGIWRNFQISRVVQILNCSSFHTITHFSIVWLRKLRTRAS